MLSCRSISCFVRALKANAARLSVLRRILLLIPISLSPFPHLYSQHTMHNTQLNEKLSKRHVIDEPLPPNWEAKIDKATNKTYYVNRTSKEKTWKRPKPLPKDEDADGDGVADKDQVTPGGALTEEAKARMRAAGAVFEESDEKSTKSSKSKDKDKSKDKSKDKDKSKSKDKEKKSAGGGP